MTSVLYVGQYFIERRYGRGFSRAERATMRARWLGFGRGRAGGEVSGADGQGRGRPQALRAPRGAQGDRPRGRARRGDVPARALGLGQVDASCAASTTSRRSTRAACRSTASSSATARRAASSTSCASDEVARQRAQIGMVFQHFNLFPHMTALENVLAGADRVLGGRPRRGPRAGRRAPHAGRARATRPTPIRPRSPAASSSAWRSPARWPCSPS